MSKSAHKFYAFGMAMPGRSFNSEAYRFGYQGSEKDNEISGTGNSYTTFFRQLDSRLGRWFSVDPVFQPWQSPYSSMNNNPINLNDVMGDKASGGGGPGKDLITGIGRMFSGNKDIRRSGRHKASVAIKNIIRSIKLPKTRKPTKYYSSGNSGITNSGKSGRNKNIGGPGFASVIVNNDPNFSNDEMMGEFGKDWGWASSANAFQAQNQGGMIGIKQYYRASAATNRMSVENGYFWRIRRPINVNPIQPLQLQVNLMGSLPPPANIPGPPLPPTNLNIPFTNWNNILATPVQSDIDVIPIRGYLLRTKGTSITISGNIGATTGILGSGPQALARTNASVQANGFTNFGQLMLARASAIGDLILDGTGINPSRITIATGSVGAGMNVGITVNN